MKQLAATRPVFHSEADFQFAFGRALSQLQPEIHVRMEVPRRRRDTGRSEYLDLLALGPKGSTAIELKYPTAAWSGRLSVAPGVEEQFQLRSHAAMDLARLYFVHDIVRLEQAEVATHGLAILLTNARDLWQPRVGKKPTRDEAFRVHEGQRLAGQLTWGSGDYARNDHSLAGAYVMSWRDYSEPGGVNGCFRWLGVETTSASS